MQMNPRFIHRTLAMAISALLVVSFASNLQASDEAEQFIREVSPSIIAVLCGDEQFLDFTGMNKKTCIQVIKKHSSECGEMIKPIIPEVTGTDKDLERFKMVGSIGSLYTMCLKALVYEDGRCSSGKSK